MQQISRMTNLSRYQDYKFYPQSSYRRAKPRPIRSCITVRFPHPDHASIPESRKYTSGAASGKKLKIVTEVKIVASPRPDASTSYITHNVPAWCSVPKF